MLPEVGKAQLTVRREFVEGRGEDSRIVEKGTKTDRVRTIPLGALAIAALRSQWTLQAQERRGAGEHYRDTGHVFQTPLGGPVAPFLATEAFRSLRARSKVRATLHDLRHSAATWMLAAGVDVASVARSRARYTDDDAQHLRSRIASRGVARRRVNRRAPCASKEPVRLAK
jgi:integrase